LAINQKREGTTVGREGANHCAQRQVPVITITGIILQPEPRAFPSNM
jgi:hypothetical protein